MFALPVFPEMMTQRLAGVLMHFVWQGFVIALLLLLTIHAGRIRRSVTRYACSLIALLMMAACPVVTYWCLEPVMPVSTARPTDSGRPSVPLVRSEPMMNSAPQPEPAADVPTNVFNTRSHPVIAHIPAEVPEAPAVSLHPDQSGTGWSVDGILRAPGPATRMWIVGVWFLGVGLLSLRLLCGWIGIWRLRNDVERLPEPLLQSMQLTAKSLGLALPLIRVSRRVSEAVAVGFLKPMILLPVAWLTELPPDMLDAVIAHELAHIRRGDLWINLLQRLLETLLFYHPAVWWLSRRMRVEREMCCDEQVVGVIQNRLRYAETLEHIGRLSLGGRSASLAVSINGSRSILLQRIRHILNLQPRDRTSRIWLAGVLPLLIAGLIWWSAVSAGGRVAVAQEADKKTSPVEANDPPAKGDWEPAPKPVDYPSLKLIERIIGAGPFQHDHSIVDIGWLDSGRSLLTSSGHGLQVWDVATQKVKWQSGKVGSNDSLASVDRAGTRIVTTGDWADPVLIEWPSGKVQRKFAESWMTERGGDRVTGSPQALAISPDGRKVAMAYINTGNHGYVRIYDADTGKQLVHRNGPPTPALCWSPDSQLLAVGEQRGIVIFMRPDGTLQRPGIRLAKVDVPLGLAFNRDGSRLGMVTRSGSCGVYSMADRKPMWTWEAPPGNQAGVGREYGAVTFTRDDTQLVVRAVSTPRIFNAENGHLEAGPTGSWGYSNLAMSPDKDLVAVPLIGGRIDLLSTRTWKSILSNDSQEYPSTQGILLRPDGRQLLTHSRHQIELLNTETFQSEGRLTLDSWIEDVAWSPDGRFIAVARGRRPGEKLGGVEIIGVNDPGDSETKSPLSIIKTLAADEYTTRGVAFTPDGLRLAVAGVRNLTIWDPAAGQPVWQKTICTEHDWLQRLAVSPAGEVVAAAVFRGSQSGDVRVLRMSDGEQQGLLETAGQPSRLAFVDASTLVTLVEPHRARTPDRIVPVLQTWNLHDWSLQSDRTISGKHAPIVPMLALDPTSQQILCSLPISTIEGSLSGLYDMQSAAELHRLNLPGAIRDGQFLPGNRVALVKGNGTIAILQLPEPRVKSKTDDDQGNTPTSGRIVPVISPAEPVPADPGSAEPATEKARPRGTENHIIVRGRVVDDESGQPIERVAWVGGMLDPKNPGEISWGYSYQPFDDLRGEPFEKWLNWPQGDRMRVLAAGYQPQSILEKLPNPLPADRSVNVTIRLKRGHVVTGIVKDHTGMPVPNAKVFYVPEKHRCNITEGIAGANDYEPRDPALSHPDQAVMSVLTDAGGNFAIPTEAAGRNGRLAVSTPEVDLCPFDLLAEGRPIELKLPAPTTIEIDWSFGYLDIPTPGKINPWQTNDPQYCVYHVVRLGTDKDEWAGLSYQRPMLVRTPADATGVLSRGVTQEVTATEVQPPLADGRANRHVTGRTKIVGLPAGYYEISRKRAGQNLITHRIQVVAGQVAKIEEKRASGASVRGKCVLPADSIFTRQPDEPGKPLTWDLVHYAILTLSDANGNAEATQLDATAVGTQGEFAFPMHLPPGTYVAGLRAYLPESDVRKMFSGLILADLDAHFEFTIPKDDSTPVVISVPVESRTSRISSKSKSTTVSANQKDATPGAKDEPPADTPAKPIAEADGSKRTPWSVYGRVTGGDGKPIAGAKVIAHTGNGTLRPTGQAETDAEGKYEFAFGPGILYGAEDDVQLQAATISVQQPEMFEKNLGRQGGLVAALKMPEGKIGFGKTKDDVILPGKPRQVDFILLPAAKLSGTLIDENEKPLAGYGVSLNGDELPPSWSTMASAKTDEKGHFSLKGIPTGFKFQLLIEPAKQEPPWNAWASGPLEFKTDRSDNELFVQLADHELQAIRFEVQVKGPGVNWKSALKVGSQFQKLAPNGDYLTGVKRVHAASARLELNPSDKPAAAANPPPATPAKDNDKPADPAKPAANAKSAPGLFESIVRDDLGRPISGADVVLCAVQTIDGQLESEVIAAGRADQNGRYSLAIPEDVRPLWLPTTQGVVWAMARGFAPGVVQVAMGNQIYQLPERAVPAAEDDEEEGTYDLDNPFALYRERTVEVELTDELGMPVNGTVRRFELQSLPVPPVFLERMVTGPSRGGKLEIKRMPSGYAEGSNLRSLRVQTESHGRLEFTWNADRRSEKEGRIREGAQPVKLTAPGVSQVTGRLVTSAGELPKDLIANVEIVLETFHGDSSLKAPWCRGKAVVRTDAEGRFTIPRLSSGKLFKVRANLPQGARWRPLVNQRDEIVLKPGESRQLDIPLVATRTLRGVVRRPTGEGVPNVEFSISFGGSSRPEQPNRQGRTIFEYRELLLTDAEGRFSIDVIPGEISLTKQFSPGGHIGTPQLWPVSATFPEWKEGNILQLPAGNEPFDLPPLHVSSYQGVLRDEAGKPVKGVLFVKSANQAGGGLTDTNADGTFVVEVLGKPETWIAARENETGDFGLPRKDVPQAVVISESPLVLQIPSK